MTGAGAPQNQPFPDQGTGAARDPFGLPPRADLTPSDGYARSVNRSYHPGRTTDFDPILPVGDLGELALPWGMLEPGTQMRGFVYFEPLTKTGNGAKLVWHIDGADDQPLVDFEFEFAIARSS